jgi:hypothetical protein
MPTFTVTYLCSMHYIDKLTHTRLSFVNFNRFLAIMIYFSTLLTIKRVRLLFTMFPEQENNLSELAEH